MGSNPTPSASAHSRYPLAPCGYDSAAAAQCLDEIVFGDCTSFFAQGGLFGDACYHVFTPNIGTGGGCGLDYSCKSGSCDLSNHACK